MVESDEPQSIINTSIFLYDWFFMLLKQFSKNLSEFLVGIIMDTMLLFFIFYSFTLLLFMYCVCKNS